MNKLDEVSQAIGGLQAQMELVIPALREIKELLKDVPQLKDDMLEIKPQVEKNTRFRWGTLGIVALITVLFNALGGPIWTAIFR